MQTSSQTIGKHATTLNLSISSLQLLSVLWNDMPRKNYIHLNYHKVAFPGFFLTLMYDIYKRTNIWKLFYIFTKQVNCGLKGGRGKLIRNPYFVSVQIPLTLHASSIRKFLIAWGCNLWRSRDMSTCKQAPTLEKKYLDLPHISIPY